MHKNTYKRLVKKLKESFPNMKTKADTVIDYNLKSAIEDSDVNQKALEDAIKMSEADKKFFMGDREAKRKISSPALKKLHLSEALFLNEANSVEYRYRLYDRNGDFVRDFEDGDEAGRYWYNSTNRDGWVEYQKVYFDGSSDIPTDVDTVKVVYGDALDESLNEAELNRFGKKAARDEYRRYAAKKDAYSSAVNRVSDTMKKTGFNSMTPEEAVDEFGIAKKPVKPSNKIKNGRVEKRNFPYYVTVYYDDYVYNPEEGGYIDYGQDVVFSKGFNTKEEAQEYYTTHQDYNEDDYRMYIETNKTYLNLRDPAKTWTEREFGGKYSVRYADSDRFYNESLNEDKSAEDKYNKLSKERQKKAGSILHPFYNLNGKKHKKEYNAARDDYQQKKQNLKDARDKARRNGVEVDESINRKSRKSTLNESIFNRKLSK